MKIDHEKSSNPLQAYLPRIDSSLAFKDIAAGCGAEVGDHRRAKEVDPQIRCGGESINSYCFPAGRDGKNMQ